MPYQIYLFDIGRLTIASQDEKITHVLFGDVPLPLPKGESEVILKAKKQLEEYFAGSRQVFDLPLQPAGTPFQQLVWQGLCQIPYGQVISYKTLAQNIHRPTAVRAVGGANHQNPISIIIPCHRVIGADGSLTGYGGGLDKKRFLLRLEGAAFKDAEASVVDNA